MITISQAVRDEILRSPFLMEVLSEEIGNVTQIARSIRPAIEKRLYETVTEASIAVAIHRLQGEFTKPQYGAQFLKQLRDITVRTQLVEFIVPTTDQMPHILEKLFAKTRNLPDMYLNVSQGLFESVVVMSAQHEAAFQSLTKGLSTKKLGGLSALVIRLPEGSLPVPGVYYPLLQTLAYAGISFVEIMSINTELSIIFHDTDIDQAFATIKRITS